jgi:hypothetical protein
MPLGSYDYIGSTNSRGIHIDSRASLRPLVYHAHCENCSTGFRVPHIKAEFARCPMNCGNRPVIKPASSMGTTGRREDSVGIRSSNSGSVRQEVESDKVTDNIRRPVGRGYFKPPVFNNDRDRESYRQFLAEEREAQEKPVREAEAAYKKSADAVARERQRAVKNGVDPSFKITPDERDNLQAAKELSLAGSDEALSFLNQAVIEKFRIFGQHHDFVPSPANLDVLTSYVERNFKARGISPIVYVPFEILVRAFAVLEHWNCFPDVVEHVHIDPPPSEPNYFEREEQRQRENAEREAEIASRTGRDILNGEPGRVYSKFELKKLSGDEYRRAFQVAPTFRDLFMAANESRRPA